MNPIPFLIATFSVIIVCYYLSGWARLRRMRGEPFPKDLGGRIERCRDILWEWQRESTFLLGIRKKVTVLILEVLDEISGQIMHEVIENKDFAISCDPKKLEEFADDIARTNASLGREFAASFLRAYFLKLDRHLSFAGAAKIPSSDRTLESDRKERLAKSMAVLRAFEEIADKLPEKLERARADIANEYNLFVFAEHTARWSSPKDDSDRCTLANIRAMNHNFYPYGPVAASVTDFLETRDTEVLELDVLPFP